MTFLFDITFLDVCLTLLTVALIERAVLRYLPETLVGPEGMLLRTDAA